IAVAAGAAGIIAVRPLSMARLIIMPHRRSFTASPFGCILISPEVRVNPDRQRPAEMPVVPPSDREIQDQSTADRCLTSQRSAKSRESKCDIRWRRLDKD